MNIKSIKFKLIVLVAVSLLVMAVSIVSIALSRATDSLVQNNIAKLDAIKESKKDHIIDVYNSIKFLLKSNSTSAATVEKLWMLDEGFQSLEDFEEIPQDEIDKKLEEFYQTKYLPKVNYKFKGSVQKRSSDAYVPKNLTGQVAQYLYLVENENKYGNKKALNMNIKHDEEYSKSHTEVHQAYRNLLSSFGLNDIFLVNVDGDVVYSVQKNQDFGTNLIEGVYKDTGLSQRDYH